MLLFLDNFKKILKIIFLFFIKNKKLYFNKSQHSLQLDL